MYPQFWRPVPLFAGLFFLLIFGLLIFVLKDRIGRKLAPLVGSWLDGMGELPINMGAESSPIVVHKYKKGNGQSKYIISRDYQETMGLVGIDGLVRWLFKADGITAFETDWTHVTVD